MNIESYVQKLQPLWDFLTVTDYVAQADLILLFGGIGEKSALQTAKLFKQGLAPWIVVTGGVSHRSSQTEAEHYLEVMAHEGVAEDRILVENHATNTGENVKLAMELVHGRGLQARSVIIVTRSWQVRRCIATFKKQFPNITIYNSAYPETLRQYLEAEPEHLQKRIDLLIVEGRRLRDYSGRGYFDVQEIPAAVSELINQANQ